MDKNENIQEQVSLKEVVLKIKEYIQELLNKKFWIMGSAVVFGAIFGLRTMLTPTEFEAKTTFMVNDDEGGGMSGISAILGQFGMGGGGGGKYNYTKIIEIANSNRILKQVLFDTIDIEGKSDLVANHIIDIYDFHKKWENDTLQSGFYFKRGNVRNSKVELMATKKLISLMRGDIDNPKSKKLLSLSYNEESTILALKSMTFSENLSIALARLWYEKLSKFYINKSVERQQSTYDALKHKTDSIYGLLVGNERNAARFQDQSRGMLLNQNKLPLIQSMRNQEIFGAMYGEVLKNKETAEFMLKSSTPFFQILDEPELPLNSSGGLSIISIIFASLLGMLSAVVVIVVRFFYIKQIKDLFIFEES